MLSFATLFLLAFIKLFFTKEPQRNPRERGSDRKSIQSEIIKKSEKIKTFLERSVIIKIRTKKAFFFQLSLNEENKRSFYWWAISNLNLTPREKWRLIAGEEISKPVIWKMQPTVILVVWAIYWWDEQRSIDNKTILRFKVNIWCYHLEFT